MRFEYDKPELAKAIDRLGNVAEQLILAKTNRMIQLSREKEARMVDAYNYMLGEEEGEIAELEMVLDGIVDNLEARGIEGINLPDQHKTLAFQEILNSAAEGATELTSAKLENSQIHKENLEGKIREAKKLKRHIDMFDDAVSLVDPGEDKIVDAEDVADAALKWMTANEEEGPAIMQRLERLQTEGELERLQTDYYARLAREAEQQVTAATADATEDAISLEKLKSTKKETQEAVGASLPLFELRESYGPLISIQSEILGGVSKDTGKDLKSNEVEALEEAKAQELRRLGVSFYPWILNPESSSIAAGNLQSAIYSASGISGTGQPMIPRYKEILNYFKVANVEYKSMLATPGMENVAIELQSEIFSMFGVDISDTKWIQGVIQMNDIAKRVDIKEGDIYTKRSLSVLPQAPVGEEDEEDLLLKQFLEGGE